jgi:tetratricopeptide (TPR) repeat protein
MVKAYSIIAPVAVIFCVLSFLQARTWKSGETLWDNVIKNQPCSRAYSARATLFRRDANQLKDEAAQLLADQKIAEANINYRKAIQYYSEAVKLNAIDQESYNNRANIYMDLNRFDSALIDYREAIRIKPDYYVALDNIGAMYARRGMYDSALYYFTESIKKKDDYKPVYNNRAIVYLNTGRYQDAIRDWQTYLTFDRDDPNIINSIGECYRKLGQNQDALRYINMAIAIERNAYFFLNRSYTYKNLNNIEAARNDAVTAKNAGLGLDPAYAASLGIQ